MVVDNKVWTHNRRLSVDNGKLLLFIFNPRIVYTIKDGKVVEMCRDISYLDWNNFSHNGLFHESADSAVYDEFDLKTCQWQEVDIERLLPNAIKRMRHLKVDDKIFGLTNSDDCILWMPTRRFLILELYPKLSTICFFNLIDECRSGEDVEKLEEIKKRLPPRLRDKLENQVAWRKTDMDTKSKLDAFKLTF